MDPIIRIDNVHNMDLIGDVHGCYSELISLIIKLGYIITENGLISSTPEGRTLVFVGDFADRGPEPVKVLRFVMDAIGKGMALSVRGNHDDKLLRKLSGRNVEVKEDLKETLRMIDEEGNNFKADLLEFLLNLPCQLILDDNNLLIAHAGMPEKFQGVESKQAKAFAFYGIPTGKSDLNGRPIRWDWAKVYMGKRAVVYGHSIVKDVFWRNNTINVDTGCFETGILTAVRWPERNTVSNFNNTIITQKVY
jgi:protein phosphatase